MEDLHISEPPKVVIDSELEISEKYIRFFINNLKKNNLPTDLFYNNYKTLKVKKVNDLPGDIVGQYNFFDNEIDLVKNKKCKYIITHELLHMSSSILDRKNKKIYSGFIQGNKSISFGYGLTEGYTQYLDERYFTPLIEGKDESDKYIYPITKKIAGWVEDIIGQEEMEQLYFHGDLEGLLLRLAELTSNEKAMKFIDNLDWYWHYAEQTEGYNFPAYFEKYTSCLLFILECAYVKLKTSYVNNEISTDEYIESLKGLRTLQRMRLNVGRVFAIKSKRLDENDYIHLVRESNKKLIK